MPTEQWAVASKYSFQSCLQRFCFIFAVLYKELDTPHNGHGLSLPQGESRLDHAFKRLNACVDGPHLMPKRQSDYASCAITNVSFGRVSHPLAVDLPCTNDKIKESSQWHAQSLFQGLHDRQLNNPPDAATYTLLAMQMHRVPHASILPIQDKNPKTREGWLQRYHSLL
jgi:hypothetical protein